MPTDHGSEHFTGYTATPPIRARRKSEEAVDVNITGVVTIPVPESHEDAKTSLRQVLIYIRSYRKQIIWLALFYALQIILFGIGIARYIKEQPHSKRPFSPGSMVGDSLGLILQIDCAILLLFPAYRWTVGSLRRTFVSRIIPFDSWIGFHVVVGFTVGAVAVAHSISFIISFYNSSQRPDSVAKNNTLTKYLFQSGIVGSSYLGYTAISGWVILCSLAVITLFALPPVRRSAVHDAFYWTHKLQFVFWASLIVHTPDFWKYFVGPFALLLFEKARKYINVLRWSRGARMERLSILPGSITKVDIRRPQSFRYNPGDHVFLKVPKLGIFTWHPFTLASSPEQKDYLTFYVKDSGNWTKALLEHVSPKPMRATSTVWSTEHQYAEKSSSLGRGNTISLPKAPNLLPTDSMVFLDGPYGSSTTALFKAQHAVLVGAGIGITPFVSVLGSVLAQSRELQTISCPHCSENFSLSSGQSELCINNHRLRLRKLDFIWITRDEEGIKWFLDLLEGWQHQEAPVFDSSSLFLDCQIFVTRRSTTAPSSNLVWQGQHQQGKTSPGLRAVVRTGRPDWPLVFSSVREQKRGKVTIFYCGPHKLESYLRKMSDCILSELRASKTLEAKQKDTPTSRAK